MTHAQIANELDLHSDFEAQMTAAMIHPPSIFVPRDAWRPVGTSADPNAMLHANIDINGCSMHATAIAVTMRQGVQRAAAKDLDTTLDLLSDVTGAGDPWETLDISGREYVLLIAPFAR